jgi:hypothetical protein
MLRVTTKVDLFISSWPHAQHYQTKTSSYHSEKLAIRCCRQKFSFVLGKNWFVTVFKEDCYMLQPPNLFSSWPCITCYMKTWSVQYSSCKLAARLSHGVESDLCHVALLSCCHLRQPDSRTVGHRCPRACRLGSTV